jgi:hypothetical protein
VTSQLRHLGVLALAAAPLLLALRFGGYHPRHAGWLVLVLAAWACVEAARGRLSAPRSASGVATFALLGLVAWTALSISWADFSRHDAWVEAMRAAGYAAMFVLGGALLASARTFTQYATLTGAGIGVLGIATAVRLRTDDSPLQSFVAGRLDWPVGYAPGQAGLYLFGMLLLLGVATAAEQRWRLARATRELAIGAGAMGLAGLCGALALLAQSRGTLPALAIGVLVSLVASPHRVSWLVRFGVVAAAIALARHQLGDPFTTQFDLRQAPFTKGADAPALLAAAESAAHAAAGAALVIALVIAAAGAALVPLGVWLSDRAGALELRAGASFTGPLLVAIVALTGTLLVLSADTKGSPGAWVAEQWDGCVHPPERVNDPGVGSSYFANAGTGRCDYYRVALKSSGERPLRGLGAGNFRGEYVRERETAEEPRVVHSLPLQWLAELGIVGLALGGTLVGCVAWAAARFVRSGPGRDASFAGAIGALGYWFAHASIDWLWQLPAVSLPAIALAGGLVACVSPAQRHVRTAVAAPIAAGVLLAMVALVLPITMADLKLRQARDPKLQKREPKAALAAARDAQSFDPTWGEAAITEAALRFAAGQKREAADAARRAVRLEPRSWSTQYRASGLIGLDDTAEGRAAFLAARRLNPNLPANVTEDDLAERREAGPDSLQNPDA